MNSPVSYLLKSWERINTLSLDVCAGAIAGGIMAAALTGTSAALAYWIVLLLAVWLIYTADHLADGYRAGEKVIHKRHIFHITYLRPLMLAAMLAALLSVFIAFFYLPATVILFGIILGTLAMFYLILIMLIGRNSSKWLPKEVIVAAFYTAGIWGPLALISNGAGLTWLIPAITFFLLAFEDLLLLSYIEAEKDRRQGMNSMAIVLGRKKTLFLFYLISALVIMGSTLTIIFVSKAVFIRAGIIFLLMQLVLLLIAVSADRLRRNDLYRYFSEAAFFLPALMAA